MAQLTLSEENLVQIIVKYVNEEYGINIDYACVELISEMGWFVCGANFDLPEPEIRITQNTPGADEKVIMVPKSLAYYLGRHFCGSYVMRDFLVEDGREQVIRSIRVALRL